MKVVLTLKGLGLRDVLAQKGFRVVQTQRGFGFRVALTQKGLELF